MNLLGISLRKPAANELTAATIMAVGLWAAAVGLARAAHLPMGAADAGRLLLVLVWACVSTRCGVRVERGARHLAVNVLGGGVLLSLYQVGLAIAG